MPPPPKSGFRDPGAVPSAPSRPPTLHTCGRVEAPRLAARLAARSADAHGPAILARETIDKDGKPVTVATSLGAAVDWVARKIEESPVGLLEFCRRNVPNGHPFQAWKDSGTGYIHSDGRIADFTQPIAAVEVQGYAYDALVAAGQIELADTLRNNLMRRLWMPDEGYFAIGLDRAPDGSPRQIESVASNGAVLLETGVFDGLAGRRDYVEACARSVLADDLPTEVGIRCRSLHEDARVRFQDYHGT